MALTKEVREFLAKMGRKGGKASRAAVTSEEWARRGRAGGLARAKRLREKAKEDAA